MARNALPGHVYLLVGDLGAGKTCLTQGILIGLGGNEYARSPTFVLTAEYEARLRGSTTSTCTGWSRGPSYSTLE